MIYSVLSSHSFIKKFPAFKNPDKTHISAGIYLFSTKCFILNSIGDIKLNVQGGNRLS